MVTIKRLLLKRLFPLLFSVLGALVSSGQTIGGATTFNFLKLPHAPLLSASGGVNVSYAPDDIALALNNPASLSSRLDGRAAFDFNAFFAGIKSVHIAGGYHAPKWQTTFGASLSYLDYGTIPQTDASGNEQGTFHPKDMVLQVAAARSYLLRWQYGLGLKFISSSYPPYHSSGIALDFGLLYQDTARLFSFGLVARNMGIQLSTYAGESEELPFDLQLGVTKRLAKAPFGFSLTIQQAHRFNTLYNDTLYNSANNVGAKPNFSRKLFNHLVLATHIYLGKNLEGTLGYNFLRRNELSLGSSGNGLNGFSAGFAARFRKIEFQYARAYYQRRGAYNQFGIGLNLRDVF
ncbi:MAG: porQ [Flaviaesturariibacter sp.]|nr:porQ [Flaviaesturariibacter sp.]